MLLQDYLDFIAKIGKTLKRRLKKELTLFPSNGALGKRLGAINHQDQNQNLEAETEENLIEIKIDNMNERLKKIEIMLNQFFKILSN
mgnify:CR=1 FL=1